MDVFVARQPIFDTRKKVVAYELLFRNGIGNAFPDINGDVATSNVLSNTFFTFELKEILSDKPGFINFTQDLIRQQAPLIFPKEHVVIEVLENVHPDPDIIEALENLKSKGYRLVLDDYVHDARLWSLVALSDVIKIDFQASTPDQAAQTLSAIRHEADPTFLAEKIETHQEYELAKQMGFKLFQGYFFSKPEILSTRDISPSQIAKLDLIQELQKYDLNTQKIKDLVKNDLSISYKLLKFVNSTYFRRPEPVDTIQDAFTWLGLEELRKFLTVIAISDLNKAKPNELLRRSIIRASMCENLSPLAKNRFSKEELFTLGLFSLVDAILDHNIEDILSAVGLSDRLKTALSGSDKDFNTILHIITCFERAKWNQEVFAVISGKNLEAQLPNFYFKALKLANSFWLTT